MTPPDQGTGGTGASGAAGDLLLRPATADDLPVLGALHTRARSAAVPAMPASVHTPDEDLAWARSWDLEAQEVWVAERLVEGRGTVVGYARFTETWLDDLYVDPAAQRSGVGSALLALVQARRPGGFSLWVFESNRPARAFYAGHGLVEAEHTDGRDNEERAPDLRMVWAAP